MGFQDSETYERRFLVVDELRLAADENDDGRPVITGYAAVFNQLSENLGGFIERIAPGAFSETIATDDVRALWNHNPNFILGRNRNGTLVLIEDETGLAVRIYPPDTGYGRDFTHSIKRGDVDQMSFGFDTLADRWDRSVDPPIRTLERVKLYDVSPVVFPAYPQTSVSARSMAESILAELTSLNQETDGASGDGDGQAAGAETNGDGTPNGDDVRADVERRRRELRLLEIQKINES